MDDTGVSEMTLLLTPRFCSPDPEAKFFEHSPLAGLNSSFFQGIFGGGFERSIPSFLISAAGVETFGV